MVRARRSKPDDDDRTELTRLLCERPLEVSRQRIPLAQRTITGSGEAVEYVGLADTADRMRAAYPAVVEFLDAVDGINSLIAERLAPSQERLDEAGVAATKEIAELLAVSATDPLSLTTHEVEERIRAIVDSVERRSANSPSWPRCTRTGLRHSRPRACSWTRYGTRAQRTAQIRARAEQIVLAGPLPVHTDAEPGLRAGLRAITTTDPAALQSLRRRIEASLRIVGEDEQLAQGLLDRRSELKGRLTVYQAKAARLGLGEDPDLLASSRIAAGLLSRRPCDLRAVTRAITDYRQMIVEKRGKTR